MEIPFDLSLLATAVEATETSFIIADHTAPDDPIIFCNTAFERLTGYRREDIIGKNCRFLQGDDKNQPQLDELRLALAQNLGCTVQLRNYRKNGSAFVNDLVISPVLSADGTVTHFIGIQRELPPSVYDMEQFHHDWRTPITIVKSTLQLLQQKGLMVDPEFFGKSLDAAIRAIERLEKLGGRIPPE